LLLLNGTSVLIIDRCQESREVLRTALVRHGLRILEAARVDEGMALARLHRPDLMVLDLEGVEGADQVEADFAATSEEIDGKLIVLGSVRQWKDAAQHEFFAKPYHYKPLVLRIEELLHQQRGRAAA
jgi:DNA-binding response OmpR family regulator